TYRATPSSGASGRKSASSPARTNWGCTSPNPTATACPTTSSSNTGDACTASRSSPPPIRPQAGCCGQPRLCCPYNYRLTSSLDRRIVHEHAGQGASDRAAATLRTHPRRRRPEGRKRRDRELQQEIPGAAPEDGQRRSAG